MSENNSVMVILDDEEYCFLYDDPSFPEMLESLMQYEARPHESSVGLHCDAAREIARDLLGTAHQDL